MLLCVLAACLMMHRSILALTLLFFAFGSASAKAMSCNYRIYRPIPCRYRGFDYQLSSFNVIWQSLDVVNGNLAGGTIGEALRSGPTA